jgi:hypothetical protein
MVVIWLLSPHSAKKVSTNAALKTEIAEIKAFESVSLELVEMKKQTFARVLCQLVMNFFHFRFCLLRLVFLLFAFFE